MRLKEFTAPIDSSPESNLVTALELLRNRYKDKELPANISTQSLINLVLNTDKNFSYQALVAANKDNPAVQNLIKNFDHKTVTLKSFDDEGDDITTNVDVDPNAPVDTVDSMAKRAAKNRGAAIA
jgi:hypothetical protein